MSWKSILDLFQEVFRLLELWASGSMWRFTADSESGCLSIVPLPSRFIIVGLLVWTLGVPIWLPSNELVVPLRTWTCCHADLNEPSSSAPAPVWLEPSCRLRIVMLVTHFCGPSRVPKLSWMGGYRKAESKRPLNRGSDGLSYWFWVLAFISNPPDSGPHLSRAVAPTSASQP